MINQIKELKISIDGLAQLTKGLKPITQKEATESYKGEIWDFKKEGIKRTDTGWRDDNSVRINSSQIEKAVDSLYLGKAWLGKLLGELGNESLYGSGYKTVDDIVPTQDVNQDIHSYNLEVVHFEDKNHIEKVDWLRQEIQKTIEELLEFCKTKTYWKGNDTSSGSILFLYRNLILQYLCEARFWLGFELERIKNENNG